MNAVIYSPLDEFEKKYQSLHGENTEKFFQELVEKSQIDVEENRKTVREYEACKENLAGLTKKRNWLRFFRVLMIITIILLPLVFLKMTPKIRALKAEIDSIGQKADELFALAQRQMQPLCQLFTSRDSLSLIEKTIPLISFDPCFTMEKETDMKVNFDYEPDDHVEQSTVETLSGSYNENPFLFERKLIHTMGVETYHGYLQISWTETYHDSKGNLRTRTRTQTLHATVTKPKPYYHTQMTLYFGAQAGPELSFSRDASHLEQKSERELERFIKRGERNLKKKTDEAIKENSDFMSMSNTDFEVLFDALDRTNEVQFRTLFTPLAQTNMVDLILSKVGYGDDFHFFKRNRMNQILTKHSQARPICLSTNLFQSHSYDVIKEQFLTRNADFFRGIYFDFAPLWAIPAYHERPVHSLKPIPDLSQRYSCKEGEVLANAADRLSLSHPDTKTETIFKTSFVRSAGEMDETCVTAYSYDIFPRVDFVPMLGGDGRMHAVPVDWQEYMPLEARNHCYITRQEIASGEVLACKNGLSIMKS